MGNFMCKSITSGIIGMGKALPEKILTNYDLEKLVDTNDEWITTRTGIKERRIVADSVATSDLATKAALNALANAGVSAEEIDLIIVATITPDYKLPSAASIVQSNIGAKKAATFDLNAGCSGWVYSIATANAFIQSGVYEKVLVIGGGPAGMQAAIAARRRGHDVTLWEKTNDLGGQFIAAAYPPGKGDFITYTCAMINDMNAYGVKVEKNKEATAEDIKAFGADKVILADIYAARETDNLGVSSKALSELIKSKGTDCFYFPTFDEIENFLLENCLPGDVVITMGAGDVVKIGENLLGI